MRVGVALSNPLDLPQQLQPVDVAAEVANLRLALADFRQSSQVHVSILAGRTGLPETLAAQLAAENYDLVDGALTLENLVRSARRSLTPSPKPGRA